MPPLVPCTYIWLSLAVKKSGLGVHLFSAVRYDSTTGAENPDFVLNKPQYRKAEVLVVAGGNFGCGEFSSPK